MPGAATSTRLRCYVACSSRRSFGEVFDEFRQVYGCRRIARVLNARGHSCSVGLVHELMAQQRLKALQPKAYRVTTVHGHHDDYPTDLIERDFTAERPGTNENTNGLLRQYFPKGTDLSRWSAEEIEAVAHALNTRPRKTLGWKTPAEVLNEQLLSVQQAGVASTG